MAPVVAPCGANSYRFDPKAYWLTLPPVDAAIDTELCCSALMPLFCCAAMTPLSAERPDMLTEPVDSEPPEPPELPLPP